MTLLLSSSDFAHPASRAVILDHLPRPIGECRLLFLPNEKATSDKVASGRYHARMAGHGFDPALVSVPDYADPAACAAIGRALGAGEFDVIYASGGNTFGTLAAWRACGLDRFVTEALRRGVCYIGGSAGAHLVCGDLSHVARYDQPPLGMTNLRGLGLVDLTLLCHFTPARQAHCDELAAAGKTVYALADGASLIVQDTKIIEVSSKMEFWDLLDKDRRPLGVTHPRGRQYPMPKGTYHLVVTVFTVDSDGRLLLTRRAPEKHMYPGYWEVTGGSGVAGEDSMTAALRELSEETGIDGTWANGGAGMTLLGTVREPSGFMDCYLARLGVPADEVTVTLQVGETTDCRWVSFWAFETMIHEGAIPPSVAYRYGAMLGALQDILGADRWLEPGVTEPVLPEKEADHV